MAGKTLIGGTAYEISGGKTLIGGTAYSIAGGKTLVSGTSYDISFGVDLAELFSGMTVLRTAENESSSRRILSLSPPSTFPVGSTAYVFSFCSGSMGIFKVRRADSIQQIYGNASGGGGLSMDNSGQICYYNNFDSTVDSDVSYTSVYGGTLVLATFDQPEAKVDAVLGTLQYVTSAGNSSSSQREAYVASYSNSFYFVAYNDYFSINYIATSDLETVFSTYSSNPSLLYLYNRNYWFSTSGTTTSTAYGQSIHVVRGG